MLKGRKILLGISGSIAAYKAVLLVRLFVKAGAEVKIIMTRAAKDFVSPLVLSTLSKNKVLIELADEDTWANHVMLGRWADVMVIAPASCNTLSKMASGMCDNLLQAAYLSATCPVVVSPAMDEDMWNHFTTKKNVAALEAAGHKIIAVANGELASGLFGEGRMAEPGDIILFLSEHIFRGNKLIGLKALVTAGPTHEPIDPVRFIGNRSSGKMGIALAMALYNEGAEVNLVTGPIEAGLIYKGITVTRVETADEMYLACTSIFPTADIGIMAAAVADYAAKSVEDFKIKKTENNLHLEFVKTKDILMSMGLAKKESQFLVGFALETNNEEANALKKLHAKNADLMVLNSLQDPEAGFEKDTNKVTIFDKAGSKYSYESKSKSLVAKDIVDLIIQKITC